jgi:hypothetical protein
MTALFPIGHGAGPDASTESMPYVVRVGRTAEQLSAPEFGVWLLAHRLTHVTELAAACADADIDDPERHVDTLLSRGLLAAADDVTAFAQRYRLLPLFVGLGNRPDDPERFAIGVPGLEPLATLGSIAYELWQWGWVAPSLWAHCEVLATIGETADAPGTASAQLGAILDGVSVLLADFVAVLDPVS